MVEWSITPVLKTGVLRGTGGSNPSLSAKRLKLVEPELNQFFCFTLRTEACLWTEVEAKKAVATATVSTSWQRPRESDRDARQRIPNLSKGYQLSVLSHQFLHPHQPVQAAKKPDTKKNGREILDRLISIEQLFSIRREVHS